MQRALIVCFFVFTAYTQGLPAETTQEVETTDYKDFCDVDKADQIRFLQCVEQKIPQFKEVLKEHGLTLDSLLDQICGSEDADYPEYLKAGMVSEWDSIEECLRTLEGATAT